MNYESCENGLSVNCGLWRGWLCWLSVRMCGVVDAV